MARIPTDELERLKSSVDLVRLVEAKGVKLEKRGADLVGRCCLHDDDGPSLIVTPSKALWHCMGACQQGGSAIDWVMKAEGVSFRAAVELLRAQPASSAPAPARAPVEMDAVDQELLDQVVAHYHAALLASPEALAYLEKRGIGSKEAIEHFRLGYSNRTLSQRMPASTPKARDEVRARLQRIGVLRESGHEHLVGSLVIPILDARGHAQGLYGRKISVPSTFRQGTPLHLYLPGPHKGVFNVAGLRGAEEVFLCESLIDALSFWCAGIKRVTTSYGVSGFTDELLATLVQHKVNRVVIAYDADDAGDQAAKALVPVLVEAGIEARRLNFPAGVDANAYAVTKKSRGGLVALVDQGGTMFMGEPKRLATAAPVSVASGPAAKDGDSPPNTTTASPPAPAPLAAEPPAVTPAAAMPPAVPAAAAAAHVSGDELTLSFGDRRYRARGLDKNLTHAALRTTLMASRGEAFHVDTLDLYAAKARASFIREASRELAVPDDVVKADLGKLLFALEAEVDAKIKAALDTGPQVPEMTEAEELAALDLLQDPRLMDRILEDFERCGVVGETTNKLVGYLAAVSRKLDDPLAVIIQSSSAAGKSSLMEAVLALVPDEDRVKYSAMTGQSLFYMGETNLQHKILAIVEEEGAERASYALKLLQSEKELTIASTGKDPQTGKLVTHEYKVTGPVMIFLTTTAIQIDEELLNRCVVLSVDEDREQTRAIHALQRGRRTLAGLVTRRESEAVRRLHKNAQRLLRPLPVVNPYADRLTFRDDKTRTRRDHTKYLGLIDAVAFLHQHQRKTKQTTVHGETIEYVEVTREDIALAHRLAHEVLGQSLDELPPQTKRLLSLLDALVGKRAAEQAIDRADVRFTRREVIDAAGVGYTQVKLHLERLIELELVLVHRGMRGQSFVYELVHEGGGEDGARVLHGLVDAADLGADLAGGRRSLRGSTPEFAGALRGHHGPIAGPPRSAGDVVAPHPDAQNTLAAPVRQETARPRVAPAAPSYVNGRQHDAEAR